MTHRAELWQGGIMVASVEAANKGAVRREIVHYAMMYRQGGPVDIRYKNSNDANGERSAQQKTEE